jgi:hypothetical protein
MAYVTNFEHDVFISFTHDDNFSPSGKDEDGWVSRFEQNLVGMLTSLLPEKRKVAVWRDSQVRSNDILTEKIEAEVSRAAVLVSIVTPRYLNAPWCQKEISTFWAGRHAGFEPQIGERLRAFKVLIHDRDEVRELEKCASAYPPLMRDTRGHCFFESKPASADLTKLYWPRDLMDRDHRFLNTM